MGYAPFLLATGLGSIPNTAAYVVAGSEAGSPTSPAFLISMGFIVVSGLAAAVVAWRKRHGLRARAAARPSTAEPEPAPARPLEVTGARATD